MTGTRERLAAVRATVRVLPLDTLFLSGSTPISSLRAKYLDKIPRIVRNTRKAEIKIITEEER